VRTRSFPIAGSLAAAGILLALLGTPTPVNAAGPTTQTLQALGPVKVGEVLPSWAGHTANGRMVRGPDLIKPKRGEAPRAVVISFFGTWCQPCRIGLRVIQSVMDENPGYKAILVAKPPQLNKVKPFLKGLGVRQLVVNDTHEKISARLGVGQAVPRTIVVGPDGVVRAIFAEEGGDFKSVLESALSEAEKKAN
jgi:thiol-disulfide isomerase/thioredoxin